MRGAARACILTAMFIASCGGSVDNNSSETGGAGGTGGTHPACASADGVRLCGGTPDCAWIAAPDCPGGCIQVLDRQDSSASGAGVCFGDVADFGATECVQCADGEACVQRTADQLVCVPEAVCSALWDLGAKDVCRYADKSHYDHEPVQQPTGACPGGGIPPEGMPTICGGSCKPCPANYRCSGRSPTHPYGICTPPPGTIYFSACSVKPGVGTQPACQSVEGCMVYDLDTADQPAALRYGVCTYWDNCAFLEKYLPGGVTCYDQSGKPYKGGATP